MSDISLSMGHMAGNRALPLAPAIVPERGPSPAQWGIISFLVSEVALFSTLIVVYLASLGTDQVGSSRVDLQACKLEYSIVSPK